MSTKRRYVQFSKRIVVGVTIAVTAICGIGMWMCQGDVSGVVGCVKAYIGYATIVFAAYSGNSAVEKWLAAKGAASGAARTDTTANNG